MTTEQLLIKAEQLFYKSSIVCESKLADLSTNIYNLDLERQSFWRAWCEYTKQDKQNIAKDIKITSPETIAYFRNHPKINKPELNKDDLDEIQNRIMSARAFDYNEAQNDLIKIHKGIMFFGSVNVTINAQP
jgi:hypothetical protein